MSPLEIQTPRTYPKPSKPLPSCWADRRWDRERTQYRSRRSDAYGGSEKHHGVTPAEGHGKLFQKG